MKIQIKGEVQEPTGEERFKAAIAVQQEEPSPEEVAVMNKVERFNNIMSSISELIKEGLMIEMKP